MKTTLSVAYDAYLARVGAPHIQVALGCPSNACGYFLGETWLWEKTPHLRVEKVSPAELDILVANTVAALGFSPIPEKREMGALGERRMRKA